jgi:molecular chaperone GrpE
VTQDNSAQNGAEKVPPDNGGTAQRPEEQESEERVVIRDRRRVDPNGTQPRTTETPKEQAAEAEEKPSPDEAGKLQALEAEVDERTKDLKRVVAEYANYRRRVDRDRTVAADQATATLLGSLLPVLDDLDRTREHGDLVGPFASVADSLVAILTKAGLTPYGEPGDPFDPMHHEAVAHSLSGEVTEPTCVMVMRRGYRYGERMLRPAMVAVADPDPDAGKAADEPASEVTGAAPEAAGDDTSE